MEPEVCCDQLARLLSQETALLDSLSAQLQREHELLTTNDVDALEQTAHARQQCVASLLRLEDERRSLCRLLGQSADQTGLATLLKWCDPTGTLAKAHADAARNAQRCREHNDRNGVLVNARLNRVSGMLDMLAGTGGASKTYEPSNGARSTPAPVRGRMVSVSA